MSIQSVASVDAYRKLVIAALKKEIASRPPCDERNMELAAWQEGVAVGLKIAIGIAEKILRDY